MHSTEVVDQPVPHFEGRPQLEGDALFAPFLLEEKAPEGKMSFREE